jgi:hypothetical protein
MPSKQEVSTEVSQPKNKRSDDVIVERYTCIYTPTNECEVNEGSNYFIFNNFLDLYDSKGNKVGYQMSGGNTRKLNGQNYSDGQYTLYIGEENIIGAIFSDIYPQNSNSYKFNSLYTRGKYANKKVLIENSIKENAAKELVISIKLTYKK